MTHHRISNQNPSLFSRRHFIGGLVATAAVTAYGARPTATQASTSVVTVSRGSTSSATVALTFDCGADRGYAPMILDTLANEGIRASFGVTGAFAAAHPDLVARMVNEGHDLINHSYTHPSFTGTSSTNTALTTEQRLVELESTEEALINASGQGGRPLFRPPFGDYDISVLTDIGNAGFTHNIMWSIDVLGWNGLTRDQVINRALSNHGNGYIYLMHVGGQSQEGPALPAIIDGLRSYGYGFVRVTDMIGGVSPPPTDGFNAGDTVSVTAGLYLRTDASLGSSVITTMPTGTVCTIVSGPNPSDGYAWYQVDTPYGRGWSAGEFLELTSASPPPSEPDGHAPGTTLSVTAGLYLRTAPDLGSGVMTTMPTGTIVTVVSGPDPSGGYTWYEVDTPYGRGWAAGEFMEVTSEAPPPGKPDGHAPGTTLSVTAGLYLRTAPHLGSGVITTMPTGTICTVVSGPSPSDSFTWYEVDTPYGAGWAAGEYLEVTTQAPPPSEPDGHAPGTNLQVTAGLWLRTAPNLSGSVIATMPTGTVCTVVSGPSPAEGYTWYELDTPYGRGWAAGEFLKTA